MGDVHEHELSFIVHKMNSGDNPVAVYISEECDLLIRVLADRYSPSNNLTPVDFGAFAKTAKTITGEPPFGARASLKRRACRKLYDKYIKRAQRSVDLDLPSDYSYWTILEQTDELLDEFMRLANSSSFPHSNNNRSRSLTPPRPTHSNPTQKRKSITPSRSTTNITTSFTSIMSKEEQADTSYQRLLDDRNLHAVDFQRASNNRGFFAWEQSKVAVGKGVYSTRGGLAIPVTHPSQLAHANPTIARGGRAIDIMEVTHHPVLQNSDLLNATLDKKLGPEAPEERKTAIDCHLGNKDGPGIELHDLVIGGKVIPDVPFQAQRYYLPNDAYASNKYFNSGAVIVNDTGLDFKVLVMTDFFQKDPMVIIDELREKCPKKVDVDAAMDDETKAKLYDAPAQFILNTQMNVNSVVYLVVEFSLSGEVDVGNRGKNGPSLENLFGDVSVSGK